MTSLNILVFNWRCWVNPAMGGAEVFTHEVTKRWVQAGHKVTMFTSAFPNCNPEEVLDGVRVIRRGGKYTVYGKAKEFYNQNHSKEHYDLIIDEVNTRPFFTPKYVKNGEKIVALIHQLAREYWFYEMPFPLSYFGYHYFEERWLKNYVNVPTATVSKSSKQDLINLGFKKVVVCPEGLNFQPLRKVPEKEDYPVAVYVGRLKQAKRPDHVVKAFKEVRERFPKAELWVIGDGPYGKSLAKMAGEGVRFFNGLDNDARRSLIQRAWLLVNPSVREGFGLNVVEANALGVPCIAYDVAGLRDAIINGKTGLLAKAGDIPSLTEDICNLFADEPLRGKLSAQSLEYSRGFSWDHAAEEFMKICQSN
jgi:glycosyltransferase involved in cell wall biosynthesis